MRVTTKEEDMESCNHAARITLAPAKEESLCQMEEPRNASAELYTRATILEHIRQSVSE